MDNNLRELFEGWIDAHFDEVLENLCEIVRIPSISRYDEAGAPFGKECLRALNWFMDRAREFGLNARSVDDMVCEISEEFSDKPIALWNHLDVVPVGNDWTYTQPFEPIKMGDWLIGRGVDDNKGPAIACLFILRMFKDLGIKLRHGLMLCAGTDEERGMNDVMHYAKVRPAAALNIVADCGFPVCYAEKGIIEAELASVKPLSSIKKFSAGLASNIIPDKADMIIAGNAVFSAEFGENVSASILDCDTLLSATGVPAHSASPQLGVNAIHELTAAALKCGNLDSEARRIMEFYTRVNDDFYGTELGINFNDDLSGQTTCAGTMARLTEDGKTALHINIRYSVTADADRLIANIKEACNKNGCELINLKVNEPNFFPPEKPVVSALTDLFNELTGKDTKPYTMSGGTYARKLPNAIAYGMGGLGKPETDMFKQGHGGAHQADEALYLPNLKRGMLILALAVLEADKVTD